MTDPWEQQSRSFERNRYPDAPVLGMVPMTALEYFGPAFIEEFNALARDGPWRCVIAHDTLVWVSPDDE